MKIISINFITLVSCGFQPVWDQLNNTLNMIKIPKELKKMFKNKEKKPGTIHFYIKEGYLVAEAKK